MTNAATMYEYDYIVFILRGEPLTCPHKAYIDFALTKAKNVITVFGSNNRPRTPKNPWTGLERAVMLHLACDGAALSRIEMAFADDMPKNSDYVDGVVAQVNAIIAAHGNDPATAKIGITGFSKPKDPSAFYLDMFNMWDFVPAPAYPEVEGFGEVRATKVRDIVFSGKPLSLLKNVVPDAVIEYLEDFRDSREFATLLADHKGVQTFKEKLPNFPIQCMTTDAMLVCDGYVLIVERGGNVGKGLLAFPGGFVEYYLRVEENLYKELGEETMIEVPVSELKKAFLGWEIEDDPNRSERCRILTHIGVFDLTKIGYSRDNLPKVVGGDDAKDAFWLHIDDMKCDRFFEDHYMFGQRCLTKYGFK